MQNAADYITALPEGKRNAPKWQIAMEAVRLVAKTQWVGDPGAAGDATGAEAREASAGADTATKGG